MKKKFLVFIGMIFILFCLSIVYVYGSEDTVYVSITGPESVISGPGATASYIISAAGMPVCDSVEIEIEIDGDYFSMYECNVLNGFIFIGSGNYGTPINWHNLGNIWIGKAVLYNASGVSGNFDILESVFHVNPYKIGVTNVRLSNIVMAYEGKQISTEIINDYVVTVFEMHYIRYDLNRDGVVDLNDLVYALQYLLMSENDAEWEDAKIVDFTNDGKIRINDLTLILVNYTYPYYS